MCTGLQRALNAAPLGVKFNNCCAPQRKVGYIMAKRTNTQENKQAVNASGEATFTITGTLKEVYVGKKACYATVDVQRADSEYYDRFKISCPLDYDFPDDGKEITLTGYMKTFKGDVTFVSND
jgi:hypothetical protein